MVILGGLPLFIYNVLKREEDFQNKETGTFNDYEQILQKAHKQASELMEVTSEASAKILEEARSTHEHMEVNLDKILHSIAEKHIHELNNETKLFRHAYEQQLEQFENQIKQNSQQALQNTETHFTQILEQYSQSVMEKTVVSKQLIDTKTQTLLTNMEQEVNDYKREQMESADTKVSRLIQKAYRDVLRKTMPDTIHQELIIESLEKAKAATIFDL